MPDSPERILVTPESLQSAIAVWLRVMPAHEWCAYLRTLEIDPKRRKLDDQVDPREILAAYLTGKFIAAKWEATYAKPDHPGGRPR